MKSINLLLILFILFVGCKKVKNEISYTNERIATLKKIINDSSALIEGEKFNMNFNGQLSEGTLEWEKTITKKSINSTTKYTIPISFNKEVKMYGSYYVIITEDEKNNIKSAKVINSSFSFAELKPKIKTGLRDLKVYDLDFKLEQLYIKNKDSILIHDFVKSANTSTFSTLSEPSYSNCISVTGTYTTQSVSLGSNGVATITVTTHHYTNYFCFASINAQNAINNEMLPPDWELSGGGGGLNGMSLQNIIAASFTQQQLDDIGSDLGLSEAKKLFLSSTDFLKAQVVIMNTYMDRVLPNETIDEKKEKLNKHIEELQINPDYYNLVQGHFNNGDPNLMWWEDSNWLDNPNNFNLDIDYNGLQYDKLTEAEKQLIITHPINAARIKANVSTAFAYTEQMMGAGPGLNNKKDAFRHAFFNAINTRDCFANISVVNPMSASQVVRAFAEAHESEVPSVLILEKNMDLFNNEIGISYCGNCYSTSSSSIANAIKTKLDNGELKYLNPLNFTISPIFPAGLNGITSLTQVKWTNP
jgi:hypothetical protein